VVPLRQGGQALHRPPLGAIIEYFAQFLSEGVPFFFQKSLSRPFGSEQGGFISDKKTSTSK
jgi:hypothetical protein